MMILPQLLASMLEQINEDVSCKRLQGQIYLTSEVKCPISMSTSPHTPTRRFGEALVDCGRRE